MKDIILTRAAALLAGAATMDYFDPDMERRRRTLVRDLVQVHDHSGNVCELRCATRSGS